MSDAGPFAGRVALVTGGSRGIGRAIALAFARCGADVGFSYWESEAAARATADEVRALGRRTFTVRSDSARPEEAARLVEATRTDLGRLDVVVASAGIAGPIGWENVTPAEWTRVVETDLIGPYWTVRAAAPELKRTHGNVVLVSSIAGLSAYPEELPYSAAKAGLLSLARSLALALAPEVRVNAIAPGWVRTDMTAVLTANPRTRTAIERGIPRGRWGEPEDVANGVLFLASDGARFITGETLVVDGGNVIAWRMGLDRS
jgi:3-oxoacyl-[acyl-carrier protein] reductase